VTGADARSEDAGRRLEELLAEHRDPAPEDPDETVDPPFDPFAPVPGQVDAGPRQDDPQDDGLPDAPLFALLRTVETQLDVERIDRIWVFPTRRLEAGETAVVVVGAYIDPADDRRRVYAAHYTLTSEATEPLLALDEYGTAPADRVGRLVEEVVERIKEGPADAPRSHRIEGSPETWHAVLHSLAEAFLEEVRRNPRLRR
jgi:hypothetical protein